MTPNGSFKYLSKAFKWIVKNLFYIWFCSLEMRFAKYAKRPHAVEWPLMLAPFHWYVVLHRPYLRTLWSVCARKLMKKRIIFNFDGVDCKFFNKNSFFFIVNIVYS